MKYQVTGNEYLSLPTIRESDGGVEGITFLYMAAKGLLEIRGAEGVAAPTLCVDGKAQSLAFAWQRELCWIPVGTASCHGVDFRVVYLTPVGEKGFCIRLLVQNTDVRPHEVVFGVKGDWAKTLHEINETTEIDGQRLATPSGWNHMFVWEQRAGLPLFAFAPITEDTQPFGVGSQGAAFTQEGFAYTISKASSLLCGEACLLDVCFGIGYEQVSAATSAKELLRQGYDALHQRTCDWLAQRMRRSVDEAMTTLLNTNLFFAFFYASGRALDTEELCLMTSRSPRYYVSAAYWDRDSLLWAFPAILAADRAYAREILVYVFTRQSRNFGVHSRFIDGTVLEPGFELDELCAPVIALKRYVDATDDRAFADEAFVQRGLRRVYDVLLTKRSAALGLFETFLQPTDDMRRYPYLTYDNALVVSILPALADYLRLPECLSLARETREAVMTHCVVNQNGNRFFAWSVDGKGRFDIYDEPPGSLQLLPFYGFVDREDPVWRQTVRMIRSPEYAYSFANAAISEIGCAHAPHPWILSICNSLLCGEQEKALRHLRLCGMDNGVACESVDANTGECTTGEAFATCAGFLAYALMESAQRGSGD